MSLGDHLRASRSGYSHHGIDCGDGTVIHYAGLRSKDLATAAVRCTPFSDFSAGGAVTVIQYAHAYDPAVVVARARSRLGEQSYELLGSNCEHFARWCKTGAATSFQVERVAAAVGGSALGTAGASLGAAAIVNAGVSAGAAQVMSGLAAVGGIAGVGVTGGLMAVGTAPGLTSVAIMARGLRDDAALSDAERRARMLARRWAGIGAALGAVASIALVSSSGRVRGLGAAGVSSGLAAVGGGMTAGLTVVGTLPALSAVAASLVAYELTRPT